jgi:hypothetical protein
MIKRVSGISSEKLNILLSPDRSENLVNWGSVHKIAADSGTDADEITISSAPI